MQEGTGPYRQRTVLKLVREALQKHKPREPNSKRSGKKREEAESTMTVSSGSISPGQNPCHPWTRNLAK